MLTSLTDISLDDILFPKGYKPRFITIDEDYCIFVHSDKPTLMDDGLWESNDWYEIGVEESYLGKVPDIIVLKS